MIIISQDEEMIVNFDNVKVLRTAFYSDSVGIKAVLDEEYGVLLGLYKDDTRANEVLKEILDWIESKCDFSMNNDGINITRKGDVFYMPKE